MKSSSEAACTRQSAALFPMVSTTWMRIFLNEGRNLTVRWVVHAGRVSRESVPINSGKFIAILLGYTLFEGSLCVSSMSLSILMVRVMAWVS